MSTREVLDQTGVTRRQLDHWVRTGLVLTREISPGSGHPRSFPALSVDRVRQLTKAIDDAARILEGVGLRTMAKWVRGVRS